MEKYINFKLMFIIIAQISIVNFSFSQTLPKDDPIYELVFVDEFDTLTLDESKWKTQWNWSPANMLNTNITNKCSDISDLDVALLRGAPFNEGNWLFDTTGTGTARMIYKKEDCSSNIWVYTKTWNGTDSVWVAHDSIVSFKYSGAMLRSIDLYKYGYFEMKFKNSNPSNDLPNSSDYNAYGPNFWMWHGDTEVHADNPTREGAAMCELDIFELDGTDWHAEANIHYRKTWDPLDTIFRALSKPVINDTAYGTRPYQTILTSKLYPQTWHTVSCEWTKEYTDFYYDVPNLHRRYHDSLIQIDELIEMPMIIDNYMPAYQFCIPFDTVNTKHPFYYDLDYVKVYQAKQEYTDKILVNTSSSSFESKVYKSLSVGGTNGSAIFNADKHHLCAEEFVLLGEGFEVNGSELTISCRPYQHDQWAGNRNNKSFNTEYDPKILEQLNKNKSLCD